VLSHPSAIFRATDSKPVALEDLADEVTDLTIIVDDQDMGSAFHVS